MTVPVDWSTVEAILRAAVEADPERVRALLDPRPTAEQRDRENVAALVAAVQRNAGCSARDLCALVRDLVHERHGRGITSTEHQRAQAAAVSEGLVAREGTARTGYRFNAGHAATTRPTEDAGATDTTGVDTDAAETATRTPDRPEPAPRLPQATATVSDIATDQRQTQMSDMSHNRGLDAPIPALPRNSPMHGAHADERVAPFPAFERESA